MNRLRLKVEWYQIMNVPIYFASNVLLQCMRTFDDFEVPSSAKRLLIVLLLRLLPFSVSYR
jgi:hypothetical protein